MNIAQENSDLSPILLGECVDQLFLDDNFSIQSILNFDLVVDTD